MRKINKILIGLILVATMFLGIGYSAIQNITLDIQGTASAKPTYKTLATGKEFNKIIKNATATSIVDTTIKKVIFDYWDNGYTFNGVAIYQNNDWETGTTIDSDSTGGIKLFRSDDGTIIYVLSASNIMANTISSYLFYCCESIEEIVFDNFYTDEVGNMSYMFYGCKNLKGLDLNEFRTSAVYSMNNMFDGAASIQELSLSSFDTSNVTNMTRMFAEMTSLIKLEIANLKSTKTNNFNNMFYNCKNLTSLDLSGFCYMGNENVNMFQMFKQMSSLTYLDLRNYDFTNVNGYWHMLYNVSSEIKIIVKDENAREWLQEKFGTEVGTIVLVSEL